MKFSFSAILLASAIFAISSCEKIEEDPYKRVEGKWIVKSTSIGGINAGEDGSYLLFNPCGGVNCEGVDYKASDSTSGTFGYSITEGSSKTLFFFTDTTNDGGFYNGEYEATLFNNYSLNLEASSILGTFRIEMKKE
jgi:hypothetical protein